MHRWFVNDRKSKMYVFLTKAERVFLWALAVMPLVYFGGMSNPYHMSGWPDFMKNFAWLGLGLGATAGIVISTLYALQNKLESVGESVDRLRSDVNVEGIRVALELAVSALNDPVPHKIDVAKRVVQNSLDCLPDPPSAETASQ